MMPSLFASEAPHERPESDERHVFVVDDDPYVRDSLEMLLQGCGFQVRSFASASEFFAAGALATGCILVDVQMPDMNGLTFQRELRSRGVFMPVVIITGHGDLSTAVKAMKAGATDFIEKPFKGDQLLAAVRHALDEGVRSSLQVRDATEARNRLANLTDREREILRHVVAGSSSKEIARLLDISPRTVEIHRARIMEKSGASGLAELVRISLSENGGWSQGSA